MRNSLSCLTVLVLSSVTFAQSGAPIQEFSTLPGLTGPTEVRDVIDFSAAPRRADPLAGNHRFDDFIGFLSNPLQNIDPRAMTAMWPIVTSTWFTTPSVLPDGNGQIYGAGLYVALSDRFSFGLNQGGYASLYLDPNSANRPFLDHLGNLRGSRDFAGQRWGWLNLGGFVQYTFVQNAERQFLFTGGLRWDAPCGSPAIFQGSGPPHLTPYGTFAKGFGKTHVLGTVGYTFPVGSAEPSNSLVYTNFHLDRQMFGWFYPLIELNATYHTKSVDVDAPTRLGLIDLGSFSSTGNVVALAIGANAVLTNRIELGAVYNFPVYTQRDFGFNGLLAKMLIRY